MQHNHSELTTFIWDIANKLRGPYRPPQYRKVMLPMIVLRRLDCVLAPTKEKTLKEYERLKARNLKGNALHTALAKFASKERKQPLYNVSNYTFPKLLEDPDHIAKNLITYIKGFSPQIKDIFDKFEFEKEIEKLNKANRLYVIIQEFTNPWINLHPDSVSNIQMGYIFEELIRKFNEQANEEAGDHFTPREVIRLMANILYTDEHEIYKQGIVKTIYDPTCGTGGMLSISEQYIKDQNNKAKLVLFGQEYNDESYAICTSDLLIKDEDIDNIAFGDTLGDGKTTDGFPDKKFDYMLANPPFGVEWKPEENLVKKEHNQFGFDGRFGPGLPRINDGALLFLLHMISKMKPVSKNIGGSKIAIVFNGSPLFTGDAGSGESNIRRWIIENDWLDSIVALPSQMFYNTGINTYIWFVTNKKILIRKGKIQLIDASNHYKKMRPSLGNKRNELGEEHIKEITRLYGDNKNNDTSEVIIDDNIEKRVCCKIIDNKDFGYLKVTVERPLRLNFQITGERLDKLKKDSAFVNISISKKRKDKSKVKEEEAKGKQLQNKILKALVSIGSHLYKNREEFIGVLDISFARHSAIIDTLLKHAIVKSLSEKDPTAEICYDSKGNPEADSDLRDTENISLPKDLTLPLPIDYDKKTTPSELLPYIKKHCEDYMKQEVFPHRPDAWIDYNKTKVGYEIPVNKYFYVYKPPREVESIETDIKISENAILNLLKNIIDEV